MEEAYRELYQQFLQLRSLCMRQAALLHQLTSAQHKHQGAADPNGETTDMMFVPVQCALEFPVIFLEKPEVAAGNPVALRSRDHRTINVAAAPDLLVQDVSKLSMDLQPLQSKEDGKMEAARSAGSEPPYGPSRDRTVKIPAANCPTQVRDLQNQPGSVLLSELMLQSHVCDFCQAIFPGDSTTKGEFLQHLHTHIT